MIFQFTRKEVIKVVQATLRSYSKHYQNPEIPVITVPKKMLQQIQKVKQKQLKKKVEFMKLKNSPVVIECKRPEFNHHLGQKYSEFNPKVLASHGWTHYKSAGDKFTIDFKESNPSVDLEDSETTFSDLKINDHVVSNLQKMNIETPTNIQSMVIPAIFEGEHIICAAETGSGKTLAYLLPILEIINRQLQGMEDTTQLENAAPHCIILVPTTELLFQIVKVGEELTKGSDILISATCSTSRRKRKDKKKRIDILVTTAGNLKRMLSKGTLKKSRLQQLVIDEADTLLDSSFKNDVIYVIRKIGVHTGSPTGDKTYLYVSSGLQVILASATFPTGLDKSIGSVLPVESFKQITTRNLHRIMAHVPQTFIRMKSSLKQVEIVKIAITNTSQKIPTLIFCNRSEAVFWLERLLQENNVPCLVMNSVMHHTKRKESFEKFQNGECDILVCTDVGSRGVDTLRATQVINFDFPNAVSDYIHRAGRVGRVGSAKNCKVISFVTHKWEVNLLWNIEIAARKSQKIDNVDADIKKMIDNVVLKKYGVKEELL